MKNLTKNLPLVIGSILLMTIIAALLIASYQIATGNLHNYATL